MPRLHSSTPPLLLLAAAILLAHSSTTAAAPSSPSSPSSFRRTLTPPSPHHFPPPPPPSSATPPFTLNVYDFGAKGDGISDDTAAFQGALDAASGMGGGTVVVPAGKFLMNGSLVMPNR
jgi:polygalacturonase